MYQQYRLSIKNIFLLISVCLPRNVMDCLWFDFRCAEGHPLRQQGRGESDNEGHGDFSRGGLHQTLSAAAT